VGAVAALLAGCAGSGDARANGPVVDVVTKDFVLEVPSHVPAGNVTFRMHNEGPDDHELIVVRAPGELPIRRDGVTIDEDKLEDATVVVLEPVEPGTTHDVHVNMPRGRYELFCNMSGHFMGGMHAVVEAS
jgi:uncharacterized cupredoxin-like copper-binding protein